jgi:hypothetical protein
MPGIGLYRTQADRSGVYLGISAPEYGPDVTENLGGVTVTYPSWCRITVKKLVEGHVAEFTAEEYWIENYATAGKDTKKPNAMWLKRPRAQLSKCTRAQGLREAFPQMISSQPTAEEMEGKTFDDFQEDAQSTLIENKNTIESIKNKLKNKIKTEEEAGDMIIQSPPSPILVDNETVEHLTFLYQLNDVLQQKIDLYLNTNKLVKLQEIKQRNADRLINTLEVQHPEVKEKWGDHLLSKQIERQGWNYE